MGDAVGGGAVTRDEARRRAEEALAHYETCPGGGRWRECSSALAVALRALLAAEPGGKTCGSISAVRSDATPAQPLPTCANCGSNLIEPAPPPARDEVREAAEAFRVAAEAWGNCTCNAPDECDHLLRKRETAADLAYLTVAWLDAALSRPAAKGGPNG